MTPDSARLKRQKRVKNVSVPAIGELKTCQSQPLENCLEVEASRTPNSENPYAASNEFASTDTVPESGGIVTRVKVLSLEKYIEDSGIDKLGFIKCDCEGHELEVFRGGRSVLEKFHPILLFECEQRHLGNTSVVAVFEFLEEIGYRGRFFSKNGLQDISEFDLRIHQNSNGPRFWDRSDYCNNFLFCAS